MRISPKKYNTKKKYKININTLIFVGILANKGTNHTNTHIHTATFFYQAAAETKKKTKNKKKEKEQRMTTTMLPTKEQTFL